MEKPNSYARIYSKFSVLNVIKSKNSRKIYISQENQAYKLIFLCFILLFIWKIVHQGLISHYCPCVYDVIIELIK